MADLKGKIAVVTGATSGIGRWVAEGIAAQGATTVVVGRSSERAEAAAREISHATGSGDVVPVVVTDLALRSEVERLATALLDRFPRIHILVNNAGAYYARREVTAEGLERTFALNVLAPYILTARLLPRMAESAPARVVMVTSEAHQGQHVEFDDLQATRAYKGFRQYGRSKLELLLLTREFARRASERPVTVNAVHPGFVASGFGRNNPGPIGRVLAVLEVLFARNVRKAAADVVYVATDPSLDRTTGEYFARRKLRPGSVASREMTQARQLFDICGGLAPAASR